MYGRGHEQGTRKQRPGTARIAVRDEQVKHAVWTGLTADDHVDRHQDIIDEVKRVREKGYGFCMQKMIRKEWPLAHQFVSTAAYDEAIREIETLSSTVTDMDGVQRLRETFNRFSQACKAGKGTGYTNDDNAKPAHETGR